MKPHIWYDYSLGWTCWDGLNNDVSDLGFLIDPVGWGETPKEAYDNYQRQLSELGEGQPC